MKPYKDFKVLLVYPNFPMASVLLPAGVSMLSAVLKKEGFQCKLFDTTLYKPKAPSQIGHNRVTSTSSQHTLGQLVFRVTRLV